MRVVLSIQDGILCFAPPRPRAGVDPGRWLLVGWGPGGAVSALTPLGGVLGVRPLSDMQDPSQISLPRAWFWISLPRYWAVAGRLEVGLGTEGRPFLVLKFRNGIEIAREAPPTPARNVSEIVEATIQRVLDAIRQSQIPLRDLAALLSASSLVRLESGDKMALRCRVGQAVARVELSERRVGEGEILPLIPRVRWLVPSEDDFLVIVQSDPLRPLVPMIVGWLDGWNGLGVIGMLEPRLWLEAVGGARWDSGDQEEVLP
jgi:hypothetical protein